MVPYSAPRAPLIFNMLNADIWLIWYEPVRESNVRFRPGALEALDSEALPFLKFRELVEYYEESKLKHFPGCHANSHRTV